MVDGFVVKLQIWDIPGQEYFQVGNTSHYQSCHGIIVVYDISDVDSFNNVKAMIE